MRHAACLVDHCERILTVKHSLNREKMAKQSSPSAAVTQRGKQKSSVWVVRYHTHTHTHSHTRVPMSDRQRLWVCAYLCAGSVAVRQRGPSNKHKDEGGLDSAWASEAPQ
mmetsp:Transcript_15052/g.43174  ORF Transcript_15052/g.43174 Transcript_15052/m.43174 type:complete len:110 (+) Transcript_15052:1177-1506(+)